MRALIRRPSGMLSLLLAASFAGPPSFTGDGLLLLPDGPDTRVVNPTDKELVAGGPRRRIRAQHPTTAHHVSLRGARRGCRLDGELLRADADHALVAVGRELHLLAFRGERCRTKRLRTWTLPPRADVSWADWQGEHALVAGGGAVWLLAVNGPPTRWAYDAGEPPGLLSPTLDVAYLPDHQMLLDLTTGKASSLDRYGWHPRGPTVGGLVSVEHGFGYEVFDAEAGRLVLSMPRVGEIALAPEGDAVWTSSLQRPHAVRRWDLATGRPAPAIELCSDDGVVKKLHVGEANRVVALCVADEEHQLVRWDGERRWMGPSRRSGRHTAWSMAVSSDQRFVVTSFSPKGGTLWIVDLESDTSRVRTGVSAYALGWDDELLMVDHDSRWVNVLQPESATLRSTGLRMPSWACVALPATGGWACDRWGWLDGDGQQVPMPFDGRVIAATQEVLLVREWEGSSYRVHRRDAQPPYALLEAAPAGPRQGRARR